MRRQMDLQKKGTEILQTSMAEMPYYTAASMIHQIIYNNHYTTIQETNLDSTWKNKITPISDCPRRKAVAEFRMLTGHDCLRKHLHRIGIYNTPLCCLCNQDVIMDVDHLKTCIALKAPHFGKDIGKLETSSFLYQPNFIVFHISLLYFFYKTGQ